MDWTGIRRYIATERLYELEILPTEVKGDVLIVFVAWPPNTSREERIASELRQSIPGTARVDFVRPIGDIEGMSPAQWVNVGIAKMYERSGAGDADIPIKGTEATCNACGAIVSSNHEGVAGGGAVVCRACFGRMTDRITRPGDVCSFCGCAPRAGDMPALDGIRMCVDCSTLAARSLGVAPTEPPPG